MLEREREQERHADPDLLPQQRERAIQREREREKERERHAYPDLMPQERERECVCERESGSVTHTQCHNRERKRETERESVTHTQTCCTSWRSNGRWSKQHLVEQAHQFLRHALIPASQRWQFCWVIEASLLGL